MNEKKNQIKKSIEKVIQKKTTVLQDAYTKSLEELVEDFKIYQFELEFQNEELLRIQSELEVSRNEFQYLFDNAPIGYVEIDEASKVIACNSTFHKMIDAQEACGKSEDFRKLINPADQDQFLLFLRKINTTKTAVEIELRLSSVTKSIHARLLGKSYEKSTKAGYLLSIIDISKQKETEKTLKKTESELKTVTDSMTDMIVVSNPEGQIIYVSPSCLRFGYTPSEMLGKTLFDFVVEDNLQWVIESYQEAIASKINRAIEFRTKHKDGSLSWVETSVTLVLNQKNEIVEVVFVVRDITERKLSELKLIEAEQFLSLTGKLANVGGWEYIIGTDVVHWTEVTRSIHEETTAEDISLERAINFYKEGIHRNRIIELINRAITEGLSFDDEFIIVTANGNEKWIHVQGEPIYSMETCTRLIGSIQDIHARKVSELQLIKSEERFRSFFHNNHAVMLLINPESGTIIDANPAAESYYGWSKEELLRMRIQEINTLTEEEIKKEIERALLGVKTHFDFRHLRADGKERDVEVFSGKIISNEEEYLYSIVHDVTDKIQLQKDLQESELRYRSIFNESQDAMLLFDPETLLFKDVNPAALELFQVKTAEDFKKLTPVDLSPLQQSDGKLSAAKAREMIDQAITGKHTFFEWKHQTLHRKEFDAQVLLNSMSLEGKQILQTTVRDITAAKKDKADLENYKKRLESLVKILQHQSNNPKNMLDHALDELIMLTESKYGFIHFYNEEKQELSLIAWSKDVMESCKVAEPQTIYCLQETGFWEEVVRQQKPIINNNFAASHPLKKGYPEGHVALSKLLSVPVFNNGKIVAVAAVANKKSDYDQSDVLQMTLLMDAIWKTAERIKAEQALIESETKFRIFTDSAPIGILILDKNQNITYVSKGFTDIYGYTHADIPHVDDWMRYAFPDKVFREKVVENWQITFKNANDHKASIRPVEFPVLNKTGNQIQTEFIFASNGELSFMIFTDISERKKAVDDLIETSAYLENLINFANAPIIVWDVSMKITRFNRAFEELSGYHSAQVIGKQLAMLFPEDQRENTLALIQATASGKMLESVEIEIQCANGETRIALWNSANIQDKTGNIVSTIAQGQDITKRKAAEKKLAESTAQLKELNATKDKLFSIIAHDLRNPFMSLLGISEIMTDTSMEFNQEETRKLAANMNHSALSAYNLLENLLEWSRLQRNMISSEPQFIQIRKLIEALITSHKEMINNKSLHLDVNIEEKLLIRVDERMIESAFINILTNAIKFTPQGGKIVISGGRKGYRKIEISFQDSGIGIPAAMLPKVFEVDETKSRKGTDGEISSGLGLIICKEMIERNNGSIRVESEEGKGSTFYVELPSY